MQHNHSEIARLRQQIEQEYEAAQRALHSPAIATPHAYITARMERMWEHIQDMERVGGTAAVKEALFGTASARKREEEHA